MRLFGRSRRRPRWTLVIVGKLSGHKTSLASIYQFSSQRAAMAEASRMNAESELPELSEFRVERRRR